MKASRTNPVPWRKCEDLNRFAVKTNVPVTLNGETVIADRVVKTACVTACPAGAIRVL